MQYIDEKFKEKSPEKTVEDIRVTLQNLGLDMEETWTDSGIENCCSMRVYAGDYLLGSNGKGITKEFARASGYGEFMERLESGLFFYKYQSMEQDPSLHLHAFAPDKRYMSKQELIDNGEWMDEIIETYGQGLTREALAEQCIMYAGKEPVLTIPYYSLFEDKYVYLPADFVEHIYAANGCCAGNSRDEAWVHALSEIMERHANIEIMKSGKAAPEVPMEVLERFPTVMKILNRIQESGTYDVKVLDYSLGYGFPVIATRIVNKDTHGYLVDVGADPVLELAIQRTLTEIFQGRTLSNITSKHGGYFLNQFHPVKATHNVLNQLENGNGLYTFDFFADTVSAGSNGIASYTDHSQKTNKELLAEILQLYRKIGKPVYVRNQSYLGFTCYVFVVPGFSESRGFRLTEPIPEYYFADRAAKVLRDITAATPKQLNELLLFHKIIQGALSRMNSFPRLAGIPFHSGSEPDLMLHFAYAANQLHRYTELNAYLSVAIAMAAGEPEKQVYLQCVSQYFELLYDGISEEKIITVLDMLYRHETVERLSRNLKTPEGAFNGYLLHCRPDACDTCSHGAVCGIRNARDVIGKAGAVYATFTDGQDRKNFAI